MRTPLMSWHIPCHVKYKLRRIDVQRGGKERPSRRRHGWGGWASAVTHSLVRVQSLHLTYPRARHALEVGAPGEPGLKWCRSAAPLEVDAAVAHPDDIPVELYLEIFGITRGKTTQLLRILPSRVSAALYTPVLFRLPSRASQSPSFQQPFLHL
jgi:hypothetical protein